MSTQPCSVALEPLESRELLSVAPDGMTPYQIRHAYGFDQVYFAGRRGRHVAADGRGQTIAIVTAYHAPKIASDLKVFDSTFGLPSTDANGKFVLTQVAMGGRVPAVDAGWAGEASLDVEWAHAIAPRAHILLVEARSAYPDDLVAAVDYARRQAGVVAVSMSWGAHETPFQLYYDNYLTTPKRHIGPYGQYGGVSFISASGDFSAPATWPATSQYVVAIGGTSLNTDRLGRWVSETAWAGSGGGPSYYEGTYAPDVAYDADPYSGFSVYDTTQGIGWQTVGGTSAGAPQWAALVALADQERTMRGLPALDGPTQTINALYAMPAGDFHDITRGSNGYAAKPGYDLVTGRGTPIANRLIPDLVSYVGSRRVRAGTAKVIAPAARPASPAATASPAVAPPARQPAALSRAAGDLFGSAPAGPETAPWLDWQP